MYYHNLLRYACTIILLFNAVVCDPPCENGVCVSNDTCSCSEGYTGDTCDEPIVSECVENLCENGGTCTRMATTSVCTCPDGYTGLLCQESSMLFNVELSIIIIKASLIVMLDHN